MNILTTRVRMASLALCIAGGLLTSLAQPAMAAAPDPADGIAVYERDVYEIVGSTLRNPTDATDPSAPLFNVAGANLDLTWGQWSAGTATSTASVAGGRKHPRTDFDIALSGLVPGGVYSIFYGTLGPDSEHPLCPGVERTLPLDAVKPAAGAPDANSFVAGAAGTASYHGRADGALLDAMQVYVSVVYHASGGTAYPFPNLGELQTQGENCRSSFGDDAMRQFLILQKW